MIADTFPQAEWVAAYAACAGVVVQLGFGVGIYFAWRQFKQTGEQLRESREDSLRTNAFRFFTNPQWTDVDHRLQLAMNKYAKSDGSLDIAALRKSPDSWESVMDALNFLEQLCVAIDQGGVVDIELTFQAWSDTICRIYRNFHPTIVELREKYKAKGAFLKLEIVALAWQDLLDIYAADIEPEFSHAHLKRLWEKQHPGVTLEKFARDQVKKVNQLAVPPSAPLQNAP